LQFPEVGDLRDGTMTASTELDTKHKTANQLQI
jgi:hypothetical protein